VKTYTASSLIQTYKAARTWPPDGPFVKMDWCTTLTARQWLRWFRCALSEKINRESKPVGRKHSDVWQREARFVADDLRRRVVVRQSHYPTALRDLAQRPEIAARIEEATP
jgi:hypothetical protein